MLHRTAILVFLSVMLHGCVADQAQFCPPDFDLIEGDININGYFVHGPGARYYTSCPVVSPNRTFEIKFAPMYGGPFTINSPQVDVDWEIPEWLEVVSVGPGNAGMVVRAPFRAPPGKVCLKIYSRCHDRYQEACRGIWVMDSNVFFTPPGYYLPPLPMAHSGMVRLGDAIYAIGGRVEMNKPDGRLLRLDLAQQTWTAISTIPVGSEFKGGYLLEAGGSLFLLEGERTWAIDPASGHFTPRAPFPGGMASGWTVGATGSYLYRGLGGNISPSEWWQYDIAADQWALKDSFTDIPGISPIVEPVGNRLLVGGTKAPCPYYYPGTIPFYWYDPLADNWVKSSATMSSTARASFRLSDGLYMFHQGGVSWFDEAAEAWVSPGTPENYTCQRENMSDYLNRPTGYSAIGLDTMAVIFGVRNCGNFDMGTQPVILNTVGAYRRY